MASNPAWRGSRETWNARVADWITRSNPADLFQSISSSIWSACTAMPRWPTTFGVLL